MDATAQSDAPEPASCRPAPEFDGENSFHEVWWDSVAGGDAPKGGTHVQLHEVWQWIGDSLIPGWARPGHELLMSPMEAYHMGYRYVRPIRLLDEEMRRDGEPPPIRDLW